MKQTYLLLLLLCASLTAGAQSLPRTPTAPFKVYDMHTGEQNTMTELADFMGSTDVLFWGEEHNDTIGHILELKMLKLLTERHRAKMRLSLEMFETDCQAVLNDYLGGFINEEKLIKEGRAWNNYKDYSPMVDFAKEQQMPVIAANAPRRYVNLVSRRGLKSLDSLSDESKAWFAKLSTPANSGRYYKKFLGIMGGEGNLHSPHMFASQSLWDATMARSIYNAHKDKKSSLIFHVCGRFHSDEYLGTVTRLYKKDKNMVITTISCFPVDDFEHPKVSQYADLADFVIVTMKGAQ